MSKFLEDDAPLIDRIVASAKHEHENGTKIISNDFGLHSSNGKWKHRGKCCAIAAFVIQHQEETGSVIEAWSDALDYAASATGRGMVWTYSFILGLDGHDLPDSAGARGVAGHAAGAETRRRMLEMGVM